MIRNNTRVPENHLLTLQGEANSGRSTSGPSRCPVCLQAVQGGKKARTFCSPRCRLLLWAVRALAEALNDGRAEGLRTKINSLFDRRSV